jgi:intracellular sulfur oxidation DsrE/DsrF family protein
MLILAGPAMAGAPAVPGFGTVAPVPGAHDVPDPKLDYKVVFDVSRGAAADGKPAAGLDRVARFVNMLAASGVAASHRHVVAVLSGAATEAVMTDASYAARHAGAKNPNTPLIAQLQAAGVSVHLCGQAAAGAKLSPADLLPGVELDLSALTTVVLMEMQGYALFLT